MSVALTILAIAAIYFASTQPSFTEADLVSAIALPRPTTGCGWSCGALACRSPPWSTHVQTATLHHITGMTREYARYVDGFAISPGSLACGLAAATRRAVVTPDVIQDQRWHQWRWLANKFGYRACWSFPVEATNGKILGTFAIYHAEPTEAKLPDLELASVLTRTAAKIMSH